jgi:hypothetical protein
LAFISLSRSAVNFIRDGLVAAGATVVAAGADVVVWAEAVSSAPATSSTAARQTVVRSIGNSLEMKLLD